MSGYVVLVTIGYRSSGRRSPGQVVKATIVFSGGGGEEPIEFSNGDGKYLNDMADSRLRHRCWYIAKRMLSPGDSIRVDVLTGMKGAGEDTKLTGSWLYLLDASAPIQPVQIPGVGPKDVPLLKGRLVEIASATKRDQLEDDLQGFIDDETGM